MLALGAFNQIMPTFQYKGLQADGRIAEGQLDAPGRPDALRQMEALGLRPVNLSERAAAKNGSISKTFKSGRQLKTVFRTSFFREFHRTQAERFHLPQRVGPAGRVKLPLGNLAVGLQASV